LKVDKCCTGLLDLCCITTILAAVLIPFGWVYKDRENSQHSTAQHSTYIRELRLRGHMTVMKFGLYVILSNKRKSLLYANPEPA